MADVWHGTVRTRPAVSVIYWDVAVYTRMFSKADDLNINVVAVLHMHNGSAIRCTPQNHIGGTPLGMR